MSTSAKAVAAPPEGPALVEWALALAESHLAERIPERWQQTVKSFSIAAQIAPIVGGDREVLLSSVALGNLGWDPELMARGVPYQPLVAGGRMHELGVSRRLIDLQMHVVGGVVEGRLRGYTAAYEGVPDEQTATRDALWYCMLLVAPGGTPMPFDQRMAEARTRYAAADPLVLDVLDEAFTEFAAVVGRTEERLRAARLTVIV